MVYETNCHCHCCCSLVSPEEIAGTYALLEVKVDTGTARAQVYLHCESDADSPTGFIELKANRTYRFFARFPDPQIRVWETQGLFGVATNSEITFSTTGRNFSGSFFNQRTRIAVTELFSGSIVQLVFVRERVVVE